MPSLKTVISEWPFGHCLLTLLTNLHSIYICHVNAVNTKCRIYRFRSCLSVCLCARVLGLNIPENGWRQCTTNRKWHRPTANQMVLWSTKSRGLERSRSWVPSLLPTSSRLSTSLLLYSFSPLLFLFPCPLPLPFPRPSSLPFHSSLPLPFFIPSLPYPFHSPLPLTSFLLYSSPIYSFFHCPFPPLLPLASRVSSTPL